MLRLKDEIKKVGKDVVLFLPRSRGGKTIFFIDTDPKDYIKYRKLGFDIFVCNTCDSDKCIGCGDEPIEPTEDIIEDNELNFDYDKLSLKELRLLFPDIKAVSKKDFINKIEE